jgi:xanthine dehydrogenase molybdopterin-binding subunit B
VVGRRPSWYVKYRAGFDDTGKLNGVEYEWYTDVGVAASGSLLCIVYSHFESAYKCDNYTIKPRLLKTNRPACVEVRSPDIYPSICVQENLIQHVAEFLGREPLDVRELNFFKPGDLTAAGHELKHLDVEGIVKELKETSEYLKRKRDVEQFNKENRRVVFIINICHCLVMI